MLPLVLPPTVLGFGLLYLLGANRPLGSFLYDNFGIRLAFTWSATVIAAVVVSFPLMYRAARGALAQVDTELLDAARTMGYSEFSIFWKVWVPVARPGVITGAVLSFARGLGEFGATAMLAGNIPGQTRTLPLAIYAGVASGQEAQVVGYVTLTVAVSICLVALLSTYADREL